MIYNFDLGLLYALAISSLGVYGLLISGWSSNSKYSLIGSIRSTAQLLSYELVLTAVVLIVVWRTSSLDLESIIENQEGHWNFLPLLPIFLIFFIGSLAETNRAPFDLPEAGFGYLIYIINYLYLNTILILIYYFNITVCWKFLYILKNIFRMISRKPRIIFILKNKEDNLVGSSETLRDYKCFFIYYYKKLFKEKVLLIFQLLKYIKNIIKFKFNIYSILFSCDENSSININQEYKFKNSNKPIPIQKIYTDIHKLEIQKKIEIELTNKIGVYGISFKKSKIYIGSSVNLFKRFKEHIKGKKSNLRLRRAIVKYGLNNFEFIIFKFLLNKDKKLLINEETFYLSLFPKNSLYNFKFIASSMLGYKHTKEAIRKMQILNRGKNHPLFGKHHSIESKTKIKLATTGKNNPMFGKKHKDSSKILISKSKSKKPVFVYEIIDNKYKFVSYFINAVKVAEWLGVHKTTIYRYIKSNKILNNKYLFTLTKIDKIK